MALYILGALLLIVAITFVIGRARAVSVAGNDISSLHSRPTYHGGFLAIWSVVPAFVLTVIWSAFSGRVLESSILGQFSDALLGMGPAQIQDYSKYKRCD